MFEFHIEIVFQSIKFGKKLFIKETLRERAAIAVALNSRPSGRSAPFLLGQISRRAVR
jgi:hypothetical protein